MSPVTRQVNVPGNPVSVIVMLLKGHRKVFVTNSQII